MTPKTKSSFLLAALLALVPVIPGAAANRAFTAEFNACIERSAPCSSIHNAYAVVAELIFPGIILSLAIQSFIFAVGVEHHFWFWLNVGEALVSWVFYFGVILAILLWHARWKSAKLAAERT